MPHSSQVLLYLARGHYDSNDLKSAKQCLLKAVHIAPTDYKLRFNAALTMQVGANSSLNISSQQRKSGFAQQSLTLPPGVGCPCVPKEAPRQ